MSAKGFDIIYVGHHGHDEAIGSRRRGSRLGDSSSIPRDGLGDFASTERRDRVALLAQTTLGLYEWEGVLEEASDRYADLWTARKSDLCYATTNRQAAVQRLAETADLLLVVGSENSSNTQALVRVGRNAGVPAYRVDGPQDIDPSWLDEVATVGVAAGASAPDQRVQEVISAIDPTSGTDLVRVTEEDEYFPLPPRLRSLMQALQALVEGGFACRTPGEDGPIEFDRQVSATEALSIIGV